MIDGPTGNIVGFLDEDEFVKLHVSSAARAEASGRSTTEIPIAREDGDR